MNGRIMNCAPGGARLANKVFPVPRLIPRPSNPREPLAAGIGRGKFYIKEMTKLVTAVTSFVTRISGSPVAE
mgnify:CR=1 FL=1